jgi:hypothetical protein
MSRPRKSGKRHKSGKLAKPTTRAGRQKHDYGNERIQAIRSAFDHPKIKQGKAAGQVFDPIGQLWAMDLLDGYGFDGSLLRDAGREYIGLYLYTYVAMLPKGSQFERAYGAKPDLTPTRRDIRFAMLDDLLPIGSQERYWAHKLLLDHFGLDTVPAFVERLVNGRRKVLGLPHSSSVADDADLKALACVVRGLLALVDGCLPDRRKIAA